MIPNYRYKTYTDDGCSLWACLNCYQDWESRTSPADWKFCPYCGIQWEGQLQCRSQEEPAWLYRLKQQDKLKWDEWWFDRKSSRSELNRGWVIEKRDNWFRGGPVEYGDWRQAFHQEEHTSLRDVIQHLKWLREQEASKQADRRREEAEDGFRNPEEWNWYTFTEYRARIAEFCRHFHNSIWSKCRNDKTLLEVWRQ